MAGPVADRTVLSGWGQAMPSGATLARVGSDDVGGLRRLLAGVGRRGAIARGLGRSYGDSAQNAGGTAIELTDPTPEVELDPQRGTVTAAAGTFNRAPNLPAWTVALWVSSLPEMPAGKPR